MTALMSRRAPARRLSVFKASNFPRMNPPASSFPAPLVVRACLAAFAAAWCLSSTAQTVGGSVSTTIAAPAAVTAPAGAGALGVPAGMLAPLTTGQGQASPTGAGALLPAANTPSGTPPSSAPEARAARGADTPSNVTPALQRVAQPPLTPTQFQSFVAETTGRALPLYGFRLFETAGFPSLTNVPVPANYVIGPGDEIDMKVWGAVDFNLRLPVDRNGQVTLPKLGPVTVAGTAAERLPALLKTEIGRVYSNFELSATLSALRSIQVFVVGQARAPGAYNVSSLSTLLGALFETGGPVATGSLRRIQLVRAGKVVTTLDLYGFLHGGDTSGDARLLPGDVIVIPPAGPRVALLGALDNPAIYELTEREESLERLLGYSGRRLILTTPHKALVERVDPAQRKAPRSVEERALDDAGLKSTVRDGDVVTLFKISPQFGNAVTLRGNVAAPLRYAFRPGMRVADLIPEPEALIQSDYYTRKNLMVQFEPGRGVSGERVVSEVKNLVGEINWDYAAIERLDPVAVRTQLIPFNLARAVKERDPSNNIELQPGDIVTIFGVDDLPVPREKRTQFVRVGGEVRIPGIYQLTAGETLPDLIRRAGGVTRDAFLYGTVFSRESTRAQQQANLDRAIRRLEADINSMTATALQNVSTETDKGTMQQQIAGQRMLMSRLQSLKASGRIALEMDPERPQLPGLVLEDGDQITVPASPSFIGVFGAVLAETSFIHKPDYTVGDYLDKAGISREADIDAAMILRADGSVESAQRTRMSLFGSGLLGRRLNPGDAVFVPEVLDRRSGWTRFMQGAKDWTQIVYQLGLGATAIQVLRK